MTFLTPAPAILAAAITVPLLLLLYFLKLRRRFVRVPSTLLWPGAHEDLQVNVPFQRLRWSLLLVIQMLILLSLLLALAQPVLEATAPPASRMVLIIDRSASMNATDGAQGGSRLDEAKAAARGIVERMGRGTEASQMMIVTFAATASVQCEFSTRRQALLDAIDRIEPSDGPANLAEALRLGEAFASKRDEETQEPVELVLLSDGGVEVPPGTSGLELQAGRLRFVQVGPRADADIDNVGIVTFSGRRQFDDPGTVLLFARLINTSAEPVSTVVTLRRDEVVEDIEQVELPGRDAGGPGEASITFAVPLIDRAVMRLKHNHRDRLAADDDAVLHLPAPGQSRVALVHDGDRADPFLAELLELMEPKSLAVMSVARFQQIDPTEIDTGARFDIVVFDAVSPARLPGIPTITLGGVPAGMSVTPSSDPEGGRRVLSWERDHPLLRDVLFDNVVYTGFTGYLLPAAATPLAFGRDGPIIAQVRSRGAEHVLVGFPLRGSNWPLDVSFAIFITNAVEHLTVARSGTIGQVHQPGVPITVRAGPTATELRITGPRRATVAVQPGRQTPLPSLERVGLYAVEGAAPPGDRIAVSLLSDVESDIRPRERLTVNASPVAAGRAADVAPRALWPHLVALAGLLIVLEWLIYCHRIGR